MPSDWPGTVVFLGGIALILLCLYGIARYHKEDHIILRRATASAAGKGRASETD